MNQMKSPYMFKHLKPKNTNAENSPVIFLFHGLGSNEEDLVQLVTQLQQECHIISVRGPITHRPGFAFYTFEEEGKPTRNIFDQTIVYTKEFILEAIEHFNVKKDKVFLVGFNQGAVIAQTLALVLGEQICATAALSGFLPEFVMNEYVKKPVDRSRIFISHGEYDYVYPIQWGRASNEYFVELGADVTFKTYQDGHGVTPENMNDLVAFLSESLVDTLH